MHVWGTNLCYSKVEINKNFVMSVLVRNVYTIKIQRQNYMFTLMTENLEQHMKWSTMTWPKITFSTEFVFLSHMFSRRFITTSGCVAKINLTYAPKKNVSKLQTTITAI